MKKKHKGKAVWIARDRHPSHPGLSGYNLYSRIKRPKQDETGMYRGMDDYFCKSRFESIAGFKLKPGECRRVRVTIVEV